MQNPDIPLLNVNVPFGPGSQEEGDMVLDYMQMPSEMHTYDMPVLPEAEAVAECPQTVAILARLQEMLSQYKVGNKPYEMVLSELPDKDLDMLNQILGEGEVAAVVSGTTQVMIQETVMAGVWRLRYQNAQEDTLRETLEVADVPDIVRKLAFFNKRILTVNIDERPASVLNAPSVMVEIAEKSRLFEVGELESAHVINLSLLPFSPEDHQYLNDAIGVGAVTILSRGYGNCRISSTKINGLWRVQYFNSTDQLILDTLEITDIPQVACAAQEDVEDSTERLHEIRTVLT
ncbi:hydrogenase expression/formation protein [Neptunomonas marina]|uniref:Hydrogenase expression/formation protein n=1 Tax=Neptunomonas marina TaxID=1815562 RepID=A0A437QEG9_9GAMM|nr:hydrogenase expression/formation protein [Neptunomonas marina]RVU32937.1 hydrogenase expression/formation protein [Neptunomonas marina]